MTRLDVGLIGAGGIARAHLPAWIELGARVTILSTDGNAEKLAAKYAESGVTATHSLAGLLDRSSVVDICTPTFTHRQLALDAIAAGKHVICEKPSPSPRPRPPRWRTRPRRRASCCSPRTWSATSPRTRRWPSPSATAP
ncbi:Gfo/Idh/MocA family protein [Streptomyces aureus]